MHRDGGVAIFVRQNLPFTTREVPLSIEMHFELAAIKMSTQQSKVRVICIYRSPNGSEDIPPP